MDTFGSNLKHLRERAGLTQQALATAAGIAIMTVSNLERDAGGVPKWATVEALGKALGVAPVELLDGVEMPSPTTRKPAA